MHTINLPYKQGYVTPVPAAVVVNIYEFREAEDPSISYRVGHKSLNAEATASYVFVHQKTNVLFTVS